MIEQGIRRHLYLMKMNVWIVGIHANWRRIADKMHVVSARRQLHPQLRSHHARSPVRGITSYSDAHAPLFSAFLSVKIHTSTVAPVTALDARGMQNVTSNAGRLSGKVALITGGGTGIGRAIAEAFAREGAKVVVAARRRDKLDEVVAAISAAGGQALAVSCDITQNADADRAVRETEQHFGALHVLVNNAGIWSAATVEELSEDDWDRVMRVNIKGPFLMSRAALPAMRRAGGGSIINTGSILGLVAMKSRAAYCASKGAVTMLTKAMALDHAHENIRVNCICPSLVETEMVKSLFPDTPEGRAVRDSRLAGIPLGRMGKPADVAELAVYLASVESSWLTGVAIPLDGGLSAY